MNKMTAVTVQGTYMIQVLLPSELIRAFDNNTSFGSIWAENLANEQNAEAAKFLDEVPNASIVITRQDIIDAINITQSHFLEEEAEQEYLEQRKVDPDV